MSVSVSPGRAGLRGVRDSAGRGLFVVRDPVREAVGRAERPEIIFRFDPLPAAAVDRAGGGQGEVKRRGWETVETVSNLVGCAITGLKPGVNENLAARGHSCPQQDGREGCDRNGQSRDAFGRGCGQACPRAVSVALASRPGVDVTH